MFWLQAVHDGAFDVEETVPGAHCVQTRSATRVCSVCKYEPGAHVCAVSHVSMPGSGWYVPAAQCAQLSTFAMSDAVPAGQSSQTLSCSCDGGPLINRPGLQTVQEVHASLFSAEENVPEPHCEQMRSAVDVGPDSINVPG